MEDPSEFCLVLSSEVSNEFHLHEIYTPFDRNGLNTFGTEKNHAMSVPFKFLTLILFLSLTFFSSGEAENPAPIILTVSTDSIEPQSGGGSHLIDLKTSASWMVEIDSSWLQVSVISCTKEPQITVEAVPNWLSKKNYPSLSV
jgi:hypothetical protein